MEVVLPARALPMRALRPWLLGLLAAALSASLACAQASRCTVTSYMDPPRQVLRCADGFMLSAESSTNLAASGSSGGSKPLSSHVPHRLTTPRPTYAATNGTSTTARTPGSPPRD